MDLINNKWQVFASTGKISDYLEYCNCKSANSEEQTENTGGEKIGDKQGAIG